MMDCPTRAQIDQACEEALLAINFHSPEWKRVEEYLSWYRLQQAIASLPNDERSRMQSVGRCAMASELLARAEERRKTTRPDT